MKNGINDFYERLSGKPLIDFQYVCVHPESVSIIWERYCLDVNFRDEVDRRLAGDISFRDSFYRYFKDLLDEENRGRH